MFNFNILFTSQNFEKEILVSSKDITLMQIFAKNNFFNTVFSRYFNVIDNPHRTQCNVYAIMIFWWPV